MDVSVAIAGQLRTIVERIEQVEEEIKDCFCDVAQLADAKREIYLEAKAKGFDIRILREMIRLRKQEGKLSKTTNGNGRTKHGLGAAPS